IAALAHAEALAWSAGDWDTLARLYMPLQEARRQRRQRCGEGVVRLDLIARHGQDLDAERIVADHPHGQLLVAGWGSVGPAARVREVAATRGLYLETFLAAAYPVAGSDAVAVAVVPLADVRLPPPDPRPIDALIRALPPHCVVLHERELPTGPRRGTTATFAGTMALWERLHAPFLAAADLQVDLVQRIAAYRTTIRVDEASELAHQKLSHAARELDRGRRNRAG
ncbi:MAG TPA: hypothetical protein VK324_18025, partial [Tepidisphaeraceae bacterium]|nr:hypothetical protein [Tepidisphaeraceae bacterium]